MSDGSLVRLASCQVVAAQGPDAASFLQSQTMNDVAALKVGEWQWNGLLNAKGRLLFLFRLLRRSEDEFLLIQSVPRGAALAAHLSTYRFRARVGIQTRPDLSVYGLFNPVPLGAPGSFRVAEDGALTLSLAPLRPAHLLLAGELPARAEGEEGWWREELLSGVVRVHEALAGHYLPPMLGLDRVGAMSLRKGCYPGQEILARSHYLGELKRHLVILRGGTRLEPGERLTDLAGRVIGEVVDAAGPAHDRVLACVTALSFATPTLPTAEGLLALHEPRGSVRES
jgi:folate-binding protein YgfZ